MRCSMGIPLLLLIDCNKYSRFLYPVSGLLIERKGAGLSLATTIYYQTLCKKGHAHLAENYKKLKPDLFLNLQCRHGLRSISMSGVAILIVYNRLELC